MPDDTDSQQPEPKKRHLIDPDTGKEVEVVYALPVGPESCCEENEISLAELFDIIWRRKLIIVGLSLLVTALAVAYALQLENKHRIQTVMEIGRSGGNTRVESAEDLRQKMTNAYRLKVVNHAAAEIVVDRDLLANWNPKVEVPRNSDMLVISVDSVPEHFKANIALLEHLISLASEDHARVLEGFRTEIENDIKRQQDKLAALADDRQLLLKKQETLEAEIKLAQQEIADLQKRLQQAEQGRQRALSEISGQAQALTMLMIENAVQVDRQRLMRIMQRLDSEIPNEQAKVTKRLADLSRQEEELQRVITSMTQRLHNFISTKAVVEPTPSMKKVGPKRSLIVLAAAALSFFGLCGVVLLHAIMKRQREQHD